MLMPKRVKYRKQMRGRMRGKAGRGAEIAFGEYGLQALEGGNLAEHRENLRGDAVGILPAVGQRAGGVALPPLLVGLSEETLSVLGR